ncbi:ankyrin repeats (3 copies) domain-containing protein [Penicillium nucicola]|uniref:ankyrin repeats (3 copies) domain-containing protein n=1 Tax=Penicillium nucicola TaxID=1850975 RepID=UPI002544E4A5|nr:ankyrin repeats (3 copies) domain-containing protein [Penicillium nucicola]KAJ5753573.1 ankyrin repeats (3 copies) domain-containing protein [Penicillium nucicola]
MAISHVWSDGTGTGAWEDGSVNTCLYDFFVDIAHQLQCDGIWWDTLCIPSGKAARNKATKNIQTAYENARITLVHDLFLRNWKWNPETACFAILMSPWFSRGWTALELMKSRRVMVIFKGKKGPVIKDLDVEILAQDNEPDGPRKEASMIIRKLRRRVDTLDDLLRVLKPRHTSWTYDMSNIAALLIDTEPKENPQETFKSILKEIGKTSPGHLFHKAITFNDSFTWCPVDFLKDMRLSDSESSLEILNNGDVRGRWLIVPFPERFEQTFMLDQLHEMARVKTRNALRSPQQCRLLADCNAASVNEVLLVREITENRFEYITAISLSQEFEAQNFRIKSNVIILSGPLSANETPIGSEQRPYITTSKDETLHSAIWKGDYGSFRRLLEPHSIKSRDQLGRLPLHLGAERGHQRMVNDLLYQNADSTAQCREGETALHRAAWSGSAPIVKLLRSGDNLRLKDRHGDTALHVASQMGYAYVVKLLITRRTLNGGNVDGLTPLHYATMNGHVEVADLLKDADLKAKDNLFGWTPLHCAADHGDEVMVQRLISRGADVNARDDIVEWRPLHFASMNGHKLVVSLLLEKGADPAPLDIHGWTPWRFARINEHKELLDLLPTDDAAWSFPEEPFWTSLHCKAVNKQPGFTKGLARYDESSDPGFYLDNISLPLGPLKFAAEANLEVAVPLLLRAKNPGEEELKKLLHWAVRNSCMALTRTLIDSGVDKETTNQHGKTPLHRASMSGDHVIVQLLLEAGAKKEALAPFRTMPLHLAASKGNTRVIRLLINEGAPKEATNESGHTPLHMAVISGKERAVRLLVEEGVNKEATDSKDMTPLFSAIKTYNTCIARLFIEKGANKDTRIVKEGVTPLCWAVKQGDEELVQYLVNTGANKEISDRKRMTPLLLAASLGHEAIVEFLLDNGADLEASDYTGHTSLLIATKIGNEPIVKALISAGAWKETKAPRETKIPDGVKSDEVPEPPFSSIEIFPRDTYDIDYGCPNVHDGPGYYLQPLDVPYDSEFRESDDPKLYRAGGLTPLHWAIINGHESMFRFLLQSGAHIEARDLYRMTPLLWAVSKENEEMVRLLIQKGAKMEVGSWDSRTPLHWAVFCGNLSIVRLLLNMGAETKRIDEKGSLAWHMKPYKSLQRSDLKELKRLCKPDLKARLATGALRGISKLENFV